MRALHFARTETIYRVRAARLAVAKADSAIAASLAYKRGMSPSMPTFAGSDGRSGLPSEADSGGLLQHVGYGP